MAVKGYRRPKPGDVILIPLEPTGEALCVVVAEPKPWLVLSCHRVRKDAGTLERQVAGLRPDDRTTTIMTTVGGLKTGMWTVAGRVSDFKMEEWGPLIFAGNPLRDDNYLAAEIFQEEPGLSSEQWHVTREEYEFFPEHTYLGHEIVGSWLYPMVRWEEDREAGLYTDFPYRPIPYEARHKYVEERWAFRRLEDEAKAVASQTSGDQAK